MKFIKLFVISVVVLFLLITAFSSLLPSTVRISRAIDISTPAPRVITELETLRRWADWNEYVKASPDNLFNDSSIKSAKFTVTLVSKDTSSIHTIWNQPKGNSFPGVFNAIPHGDITTVQWYFEFAIKWYPWEKFGSIIYDQQLGPEMEKSLQNLKILLEKAP